MLQRLVLALLVGFGAFLACLLLGVVIGALNFPPATAIGAFLTQWAAAIGLAVALWHFFSGGSFTIGGS